MLAFKEENVERQDMGNGLRNPGTFGSLLDRLVEAMWPFTLTVGVIMATAVVLFLLFAFVLIYGTFLGHFPEWLVGWTKP